MKHQKKKNRIVIVGAILGLLIFLVPVLCHPQEGGERIVVGVNTFTIDESETPGGYFRNPAHERELAGGKQILARLRRLKETRNTGRVRDALENLRQRAVEKRTNLVPLLIEAARNYATVGEMMGTIREAYGLTYDPFGDVESPFH